MAAKLFPFGKMLTPYAKAPLNNNNCLHVAKTRNQIIQYFKSKYVTFTAKTIGKKCPVNSAYSIQMAENSIFFKLTTGI